MQQVRISNADDFEQWIELARQVEPLFGPMVGDEKFREGLRQTLVDGYAYCIRTIQNPADGVLPGGIIISLAENEILWFAVAQSSRGQGLGKVLLREALGKLDHDRPISVTTFDKTVPAGMPARRLYQSLGFKDHLPGSVNPAGIPTAVMVLNAEKR